VYLADYKPQLRAAIPRTPARQVLF